MSIAVEIITIIGSALVAGIFSVIVSVINGNNQIRIATEKVKEEKDAQTEARLEAFKQGLRALLKDRMYTVYKNVCKNGYITVQELENFNDMYNQYHTLGGNGVMTAIKDRLNTKIKLVPDDDGNTKTN